MTVTGTVNTNGGLTVQNGTLALSGVNTITQGITVGGGVGDARLLLGSSGAAGGAAGSITTLGSVVSFANGVNVLTPFTLNSNDTQLEVLAADAATQSGVLSEIGGSRDLEKIGTGTLTLSADNSYTGATAVSAGTLIVTGNIDSTVVTVQTGATISANGTALADAAAVTLNGTGNLTLTGSETIGSLASASATSDVTLGGSTLTTGSAGPTSFAGDIGGTGGLVQAGGGTFTLTGANTYTGATDVNAGTLSLTGSGALASTDIDVAGTAALTSDGGAFAPAADIDLAGTSTLTLTGNEAISKLDTAAGTTATLTGSTLTLSSNSSGIAGLVTGTGTLAVNGGTTTVAATGNIATATTIGASGTVVNDGTMAGVTNQGSFTNNLTAGAVSNSGTGTNATTGTMASLNNTGGTFTNAGIVTGNTTVAGGTVTLNAGSNLSNSGTVTVTTGTLDINIAETFGALVANGGTTTVDAQLTTGELSGTAGSIVLGGATGMIVGDSDMVASTFGGVISGGGFLQKVGTDLQTLTGVNTLTGGITASGGTLAFTGAGSALTTSFITIDMGGAVETDGGAFATTLVITNNGAFNLVLGGDESIANINGTGTIALSSGSLLTLNAGASVIDGIISGAGGLTVQGTSATTLNAMNSFTGDTTLTLGSLTIGAAGGIVGNLIVNGGVATNNGNVGNATGDTVTVAAAGTFDNNSGGAVAGTLTTLGTVTNDSGAVINALVVDGGTTTNDGTVTTTADLNAGILNNTANGVVGGNVTVDGGTLNNDGDLGNAGSDTVTVAAGATLNNNATGDVLGTLTTSGFVTNDAGGQINALVVNLGTMNNDGEVTTTADLNAGILNNTSTGTVLGNVTVDGGTLNNDGDLGNAGSDTVAVAAGATLNNNAAGDVLGTLTNSGTTTNDAGGQINALVNSAGTTTNDGEIVGTLVVNGGTVAVNATGTVGGTTQVNATGALAITGGSFTGAVLNNGGALDILSGTFLAGLTNADGTVDAAGTITGNVINNDAFNATSLAVTGAFSNLGGPANLQIFGDMTVSGAFANTGLVDLANGVFTDSLVVASLPGGSAGAYVLDLNLAVGQGVADSITVTAGGVTSVTLDFAIVGTGYLGGPITVFTGLAAGATLTTDDLPIGGSIVYTLDQSGNQAQVVSLVNPAVSGVAAASAMTQSLISSVVNRPTSPFVSGLAAEEGCSSGGYFRATGGQATVTGTSTSNDVSISNDIRSSYYGAQGGYDIGCFDGRFFNGWDGAIGIMAGLNKGSTEQTVFSDPINQVGVLGETGSDFDQKYLGIYVAGSRDKISGDVQLRYDLTDFTLNDDLGLVGLDGEEFSTRTTTIGTRVNYRFDLNEEQGISLVPTVGFNYSQTSGDTVVFNGDEVLTIDPFNSFIGFLGTTLTKTVVAPEGTSALTYFASGNYYQDFSGNRSATYEDPGIVAETDIDLGGIGGFAEASFGLNYVKVLESGAGGPKQLNANIRADLRAGENVSDAYSLTAQVRLSF